MHKIIKKVYYHDTDCGGVVYYANYLKYFEEARTEFFAAKGINLAKITRQGFAFVVKTIDITYQSPARYGQVLEVKTEPSQLKNVSMCFSQTVEAKNCILVSGGAKLVCVNKFFKAAAIPSELLNKIKNGL